MNTADELTTLVKQRDKLHEQQRDLARQLLKTSTSLVDAVQQQHRRAQEAAFEIAADPPLPKDRRCVLCRRELPEGALKNNDPFCSTECAKTWHSRLARRLNLFPAPGVLIARNTAPLLLTGRDLLWIVEEAIPRMRREKTKADIAEQGDT